MPQWIADKNVAQHIVRWLACGPGRLLLGRFDVEMEMAKKSPHVKENRVCRLKRRNCRTFGPCASNCLPGFLIVYPAFDGTCEGDII